MNTMSAAASRSEHQRAFGDLIVDMKLRDGATVLGDLRQDGCLKARFPRPVDFTEVVLLNSSGGVAGGDRLRLTLGVGAHASACFASQAAERFYRALPADPPSYIRTSLRLDEGASAEWLPQESILFDRCALDRQLDITMAAGARLIAVEALVFGRALMGEQVASARLSDTIRIRQNGKLLLHEAIRLDGPVAQLLARPAIGNFMRAVATIIYVADDTEVRRDALRAAWADAPAECAASAWNGMLLARVAAPDSAALRATVVAGLECLRDGRALPRVWNC